MLILGFVALAATSLLSLLVVLHRLDYRWDVSFHLDHRDTFLGGIGPDVDDDDDGDVGSPKSGPRSFSGGELKWMSPASRRNCAPGSMNSPACGD